MADYLSRDALKSTLLPTDPARPKTGNLLQLYLGHLATTTTTKHLTPSQISSQSTDTTYYILEHSKYMFPIDPDNIHAFDPKPKPMKKCAQYSHKFEEQNDYPTVPSLLHPHQVTNTTYT